VIKTAPKKPLREWITIIIIIIIIILIPMQDSQSRLLREFVVFLSEFFASSLAIKGREKG
jgi:hypothetical protein